MSTYNQGGMHMLMLKPTQSHAHSGFQINASGESAGGGGGKNAHGKDIFRKVKDLRVEQR